MYSDAEGCPGLLQRQDVESGVMADLSDVISRVGHPLYYGLLIAITRSFHLTEVDAYSSIVIR